MIVKQVINLLNYHTCYELVIIEHKSIDVLFIYYYEKRSMEANY